MERNIGLDIIKILACFAVVILHVTGIVIEKDTGYTVSQMLYYLSSFAIPIFFMVNGNLLLNKKDLGYRYVLNKVVNILGIILAWNGLLFVAKLIFGRLGNPFISTASNLLQRGYFFQFWFFGALILIYCTLPIVHKYWNNIRFKSLIVIIFVCICLIIDTISIILSITGTDILQVHVIQTFRIWTWYAYYLLGGLFGNAKIKYYLKSKITFKTNLVVLTISAIIVSVYQYNMAKLYNIYFCEYFYDNIFTFIYVASMFLLFYRQDFKNRKAILSLSSNIMGIYIVHTTVIKVFMTFYSFDSVLSNVCMIFMVFILSYAISFVISKIPIVNKLTKI